MKVQDLKKCQVQRDKTHKVMLINDRRAPVDIWHFSQPEDEARYFDGQGEAFKAAALFRAAYEMQQAIRQAVAWFEEGGAKGYSAHKGLLIALELSENTAEVVE